MASIVALVILIASSWASAEQARFPQPPKDKDRNVQRNLSGQVVDPQGKSVAEAVVYLKDKRSLQMQTHITDEKGAYRFSGLDANADYEVRAEYKGSSSPKRTVSSFDDRKEIYLVLELGPQQ